MFFSCATLYKTSMDSEIPEFSVLEISSNGWDGDENTDIKIPSSGDYDEFDEFEAAEKNRAIEKNEGVEISK